MERKFSFVVWVVSFLILGASVAKADVMAEVKFSNGAKLQLSYGQGSLITSNDVVFVSPEGASNVLTQELVTHFPTSGRIEETGLPSVLFSVSGRSRSALFETNKGFWFVTQKGVARKLPVEQARMAYTGAGFPAIQWMESTLGGKEYLLATFRYGEYDDEAATGDGVTFLIREDGLWVRVSNQSHKLTGNEDRAVVHDDMWSFPAFSRQVDLRAFAAEARRGNIEPETVNDPEGKAIENLEAVVVELFPDQVAFARRRPEKFFPMEDGALERKLRAVLKKPETGNVVLFGDSGTGKTEFVRSFIAAVAAGKYADIPRTQKILLVDAGRLGAGARYTGHYESRIRALIEYCRREGAILFIDNIHALRGNGTHSGNNTDGLELLRPALTNGDVRVIATSSKERFFNAFAADQALIASFTTLVKEEASDTSTLAYVRNWARQYNKPVPSDVTIEHAIRLADTYISTGANPQKTIRLVEACYSLVELDEGEGVVMTTAHLDKAVQELYRAEPAQFDPVIRERKIQALIKELELNLIGQRRLREVAVALIRQYYAGVHDGRRPPVRIFASGRPGTGKTEIGVIIARALGRKFKRIEMGNFKLPDPRPFLQELAAALREDPFSVIVLDELPLANMEVQTAALALLDSGRFTIEEAMGASSRTGVAHVPVRANHAFFIATSNAAMEYLDSIQPKTASMGFATALPVGDDLAEPVMPEDEPFREAIIADRVAPAVLDRFQEVVPTFPPTRLEFTRVLNLHVNEALKEISTRKRATFQMINTESFAQAEGKRHWRPRMSNRKGHELVQRIVRDSLAHEMISWDPPVGSTVQLTYDEGTQRVLVARPTTGSGSSVHCGRRLTAQ